MLPLFMCAWPFLFDAPYGPTFWAFNPLSGFVSAAAFNGLGFLTGLLPPLGWT